MTWNLYETYSLPVLFCRPKQKVKVIDTSSIIIGKILLKKRTPKTNGYAWRRAELLFFVAKNIKN